MHPKLVLSTLHTLLVCRQYTCLHGTHSHAPRLTFFQRFRIDIYICYSLYVSNVLEIPILPSATFLFWKSIVFSDSPITGRSRIFFTILFQTCECVSQLQCSKLLNIHHLISYIPPN